MSDKDIARRLRIWLGPDAGPALPVGLAQDLLAAVDALERRARAAPSVTTAAILNGIDILIRSQGVPTDPVRANAHFSKLKDDMAWWLQDKERICASQELTPESTEPVR